MSRLDNLQTVFDRTDWSAFNEQMLSLAVAIDSAKFRGREQTASDMQALMNWLSAIEYAAKMDGYQTEKEPTQ